MRDLGLKDKVVLITGGAGVLGTAFSQGFTDYGAKLAINDLKEEKSPRVHRQAHRGRNRRSRPG